MQLTNENICMLVSRTNVSNITRAFHMYSNYVRTFTYARATTFSFRAQVQVGLYTKLRIAYGEFVLCCEFS